MSLEETSIEYYRRISKAIQARGVSNGMANLIIDSLPATVRKMSEENLEVSVAADKLLQRVEERWPDVFAS